MTRRDFDMLRECLFLLVAVGVAVGISLSFGKYKHCTPVTIGHALVLSTCG